MATGLQLLFDDDDYNSDLPCPLDRIDSNGHYEPGYLQIVCRFATQSKGASDNSRFITLIGKIRADTIGR